MNANETGDQQPTTWQEELAAMTKIVEALMVVDAKSRRRVFNYLWDRFVTNPAKEDR